LASTKRTIFSPEVKLDLEKINPWFSVIDSHSCHILCNTAGYDLNKILQPSLPPPTPLDWHWKYFCADPPPRSLLLHRHKASCAVLHAVLHMYRVHSVNTPILLYILFWT
jgi:hypothetical protein